jgi:hypothetical protein
MCRLFDDITEVIEQLFLMTSGGLSDGGFGRVNPLQFYRVCALRISSGLARLRRRESDLIPFSDPRGPHRLCHDNQL